MKCYYKNDDSATPYKLRLNTVGEGGFSFLETAMVVLIIGLIIGGVLSAVSYQTRFLAAKYTEERMERVVAAINSFAVVNNRLPCPAVNHLADDDANIGLEYCENATDVYDHDVGATKYSGGMVPHKAVGLSLEQVSDFWGNRLSYAVVENYTGDAVTYGSDGVTPKDFADFYVTPPGLFTVYSTTGTSPVLANDAVYVLISHGKNSHSSFVKEGDQSGSGDINSATAASSDSHELENFPSNSNSWDHIFRANVASVDHNIDSGFDDIVKFQSLNDIAFFAGKQLTDVGCAYAADALKAGSNSAANLCTNGSNNCVQLVTI
ncbi:MAG: hypothetical protein AAF153_02440, partial [Pseudomonadota bacterium]